MQANSLTALIPLAVLAAPGSAAPPPPQAALATLAGPPSTEYPQRRQNVVGGNLRLVMTKTGVHITGVISVLAPDSVHGFHVYAARTCEALDRPDAGGHFNPYNAIHAPPTDPIHHLGDMLNLRADDMGRVRVDTTLVGATLGDAGRADVMGRAIVVNALPDDYTTQPAGDAGRRIACGVIRPLP